MSGLETAKDIEDQAVDWAVRIDARPLGEDQARFDTWLAGDHRCRGALLRAQAGLLLIGASEVSSVATVESLRRPDRRRLVAGIGAAAAALGGLTLIPLISSKRYKTNVGEIRRVPLSDGSLAAINTDTTIDIGFQPKQRTVRLDRGEAWFQVAKDASRPFVVTAGLVQVRAVGTAFSVRRRAGGVDVLVTEGTVEVTSARGGRPTRISAGDQMFVSNAGKPARPLHRPLEMDRTLAWRDGQIALDGDTIAAAVNEFNRYNTRKIVITDPRLEGRLVVGWFHANEPESFARAVALSENVDIDVSSDVIMLGG